MASLSHSQKVTRLYRKSLKHMLSWTIDRGAWRQQAVELRSRFDANKDIRDMKKATQLLLDGEEEFNYLKHPDPYILPTAPGGSKWERNMPLPPQVLKMTPDEQIWYDEALKNTDPAYFDRGHDGIKKFEYPKYVWSPAGGWWCDPIYWKRNTAYAFLAIIAISIPVAYISEVQ